MGIIVVVFVVLLCDVIMVIVLILYSQREGEDGNGEESGDDDYDDDEEEEEAPGITINGRISVSTRIVAWTVATGRGGTGIGLAEQLLLLQLSIRGWR